MLGLPVSYQTYPGHLATRVQPQWVVTTVAQDLGGYFSRQTQSLLLTGGFHNHNMLGLPLNHHSSILAQIVTLSTQPYTTFCRDIKITLQTTILRRSGAQETQGAQKL